MNDFSLNGVGGIECVTLPLDEDTIKAIDYKLDDAVSKAVALTSDNTVGYGADGDALFGVLKKVERDGYATVQVKGYACGITADSTAAINKYAAVDGSGGIKAASGTSRGYITSADGSSADILM